MTTNVSGLPLVTRSMQINLDAPSSNIGVPTLSSCSPDASSSMLARHAQHKAAQKGEPEAPVAATDSGLTPLCLAARLGNAEEVATLLGMGAWCGPHSETMATPLMIAAREGHQPALELLLPASMQVIHSQDKEGNTALHLAALHGHRAAVSALVNAGADIAQKNARNNTPLALSARAGHVEATQVLLDSDHDPERSARNGMLALKHAAHKHQLEVVELLLRHGVAVDDETMQLTQDGMVSELLRRAPMLMLKQSSLPIAAAPQIDGDALVTTLVVAAAKRKHAGSWDRWLKKRDICDGLALTVQGAASDLRAVWASLAGSHRKMTAAQQTNWCAGILADLDNAMLSDPPYTGKELTSASEALFNKLAEKQARVLAQAGLAAEQALRDGLNDLRHTCMQAVSGEKFDPLALYQLLTDQHGIYHTVASLIVSAFADVWPHRNSLGEHSLAHALAGELSEHRQKQKLVQAISSSSATVDNQQIVLMLTYRQVALLAGWCDKALGQ